MYAGGVGGAQHGAQIAGFFDAFDHQQQRMGRQFQVIQRQPALFSDGNQPVRPVAIGQFLERRLAAIQQIGARCAALFQNAVLVGSEKQRPAEEQLADAPSAFQCAAHFAETLNEHLLLPVAIRPIAQPQGPLQPFIRCTGDTDRHAGIIPRRAQSAIGTCGADVLTAAQTARYCSFSSSPLRASMGA